LTSSPDTKPGPRNKPHIKTAQVIRLTDLPQRNGLAGFIDRDINHFGLGHGSGAHAPDEYYIIESANPKIQGFDGAVMSFVEYLYELAK
jgi:hypothetical protein